ncbi:hypothetical protein DMC30DRAFT_391366 [Rhodotorula diobovata]|uniref:Uncharacterized protein n=1 Tax=Rhodotorula diobovata TaxID=5288 RepID=A0A5C5G2P0_9BASI|nr:hypothetical protein DMC30DRAFT_391366 [Rhodotorula diobovata]
MHRLSLVQLERVAFPSAITLCLLPSSVAAPAPACPPARARLSKPQVPHLARRPPSPAPARHHRHPRRRDARAPARARDGRDALAAAVGGGAEGAPARQGGAGWAERRGGGGGARQAREGELGLDLVARPHRHGHVLPLRPDALDAQFLAPETQCPDGVRLPWIGRRPLREVEGAVLWRVGLALCACAGGQLVQSRREWQTATDEVQRAAALGPRGRGREVLPRRDACAQFHVQSASARPPASEGSETHSSRAQTH